MARTQIRLAEFSAFIQAHGHHRVSRKDGPCKTCGPKVFHKKLARWLNDARTRYKRGTISLNTRESLEAFGFDWEPRARKQRVGADSALPGTVFKTRDQRRFAELREFARMHGGSLRVVLSKDPCSICEISHKQLAQWVRHIKVRKLKGTIPVSIDAALEDIGFWA